MAARNVILLVFLGLIVAVFIAGLSHLAKLRFEAGDVYPPYSSLRTDPLGTKALYESLEDVGKLHLDRNYRPLAKFPAAPGTTLVVIGTKGTPEFLQKQDSRPEMGWEPMVEAGMRLVLAFHRDSWFSPLPSEMDVKAGVSLGEFRTRYGSQTLPAAEDQAKPASGGAEVDELPWQSKYFFEKLSPQWQVLYTCGNKPVIIERPYGKGSIVLCADSYFLSNEAMLKHPRPKLLARVIHGPRVVFDETHLGVQEEPGIAALARSYNLGGAFLLLLGLTALVVWRSAGSFIPRGEGVPAAEIQGHGKGRGSAASLLGLVRRSVRPTELLSACFREWQHTADMSDRRRVQAAQVIKNIIDQEQCKPAKQQDPAQAYRAICQALMEKKHHGN